MSSSIVSFLSLCCHVTSVTIIKDRAVWDESFERENKAHSSGMIASVSSTHCENPVIYLTCFLLQPYRLLCWLQGITIYRHGLFGAPPQTLQSSDTPYSPSCNPCRLDISPTVPYAVTQPLAYPNKGTSVEDPAVPRTICPTQDHGKRSHLTSTS